MREYLVFRLYGPLMSFGDIAVGETRHTYDRPSKSAVLGLVAAAFGIRRAETDRHTELHASLGFATCIDAPGRLLRDYHTVQTVPTRRGITYTTRRDELTLGEPGTILTSRDYRCDALYRVALWKRVDSSAIELDAIRNAIEKPKFVLYLGRKSCPPALPLAPMLIKASNVHAAFQGGQFHDGAWTRRIPVRGTTKVRVFWEDEGGESAIHRISRRDSVGNRERWQFLDREEFEGFLEG